MPSRKISRAFHWGLRVEPGKREGFVERVFGDDTGSARELRALFKAHESAGRFLQGDALQDSLQLLESSGSPLDLAPGDTIGDFLVQRPLGRGAFGTVYLASQVSLGRTVAIKVTPDLGGEGRMMAQLDHPNILRVYSETTVPERGVRVLCMPYLSGMDLARLLRLKVERGIERLDGKAFIALLEGNTLSELADLSPIGLLVHLGVGLARALGYASRRGILHLDVKPANILVSPAGVPLLADFSVAARQGQKAVGGTARYMAPEQREQDEVDGRADLYSLGMVLREMISEGDLCTMGTAGEAAARVLTRLTERDRVKRYSSAEELEEALLGCARLEGLDRALPPIPLAERYARPMLALAGALPLLTLLLRNSERAALVVPTLALILAAVALARTRRRQLLLPWMMAFLAASACLGESLIGFLVFLRGGAEEPFLFIPAMRGEIALTGAALGVGLVLSQWIALRVLFPRQWVAETDILRRAREDLGAAATALRHCALFVLAIPLTMGLRLCVPLFGAKVFPAVGVALLIFAGCTSIAVLGSYLIFIVVSRAFENGPVSPRLH